MGDHSTNVTPSPRSADAIHSLEQAIALGDAPYRWREQLAKYRDAVPVLISCTSIDDFLQEGNCVGSGDEWRCFKGKASLSLGLEWTRPDFDGGASLPHSLCLCHGSLAPLTPPKSWAWRLDGKMSFSTANTTETEDCCGFEPPLRCKITRIWAVPSIRGEGVRLRLPVKRG